MIVNTITEAKAQLSKLIEKVEQGEEIVIARAGKPAARLVPFEPMRHSRQPGSMAGKIQIAEDFDALPDDLAVAFGMIE